MRTRTECEPTICDGTLMSEDNVFMTKDLITAECLKCSKEWVCKAIIDLLDNNKPWQAQRMLIQSKSFITDEE